MAALDNMAKSVQERQDISIPKAKNLIQLVILAMKKELKETGELRLTEFGNLKVVDVPARKFKGPLTGGKEVVSPAHKVVRWKQSKVFFG